MSAQVLDDCYRMRGGDYIFPGATLTENVYHAAQHIGASKLLPFLISDNNLTIHRDNISPDQ